jgi:hypothetical protein
MTVVQIGLSHLMHLSSQRRCHPNFVLDISRVCVFCAVQDVANALWALATLQARPSSELQSFLLIRVQAHFAMLKPCEVATTLWALSQLGAVPPSSWTQELLLRQVGRQQWQGTQPRHWVMCLVACAQLKQVRAGCCCGGLPTKVRTLPGLDSATGVGHAHQLLVTHYVPCLRGAAQQCLTPHAPSYIYSTHLTTE